MAKNIKLVKSLIGRKKDQIATAQSARSQEGRQTQQLSLTMLRLRVRSIKFHTSSRLLKRKQGGAQ